MTKELLFLKVIDLPNVILPKDFVEVLQSTDRKKLCENVTWNAEKDFLE